MFSGIENYGAFLLAGIILNLTPGADTMYILARSITQGKKAGIYSVLGISAGIVIHTLAAAFGLSVILAQSAVAFNIVKYAGAAYLVFLGVKSLLSKSNNMEMHKEESILSNKKIFISGMLTNVLNPKVALFFLAFLPQFIKPGYTQDPTPYLILGLTFITTGTTWTLLVAILASGFAGFIKKNPQVENWLNRIAGGVFILLGLKIAFEKK